MITAVRTHVKCKTTEELTWVLTYGCTHTGCRRKVEEDVWSTQGSTRLA